MAGLGSWQGAGHPPNAPDVAGIDPGAGAQLPALPACGRSRVSPWGAGSALFGVSHLRLSPLGPWLILLGGGF